MTNAPTAFNAPKTKKAESLGDNIKTVIYALLIALVLRSVLVQPFNIPSSSMRPTLIEGDYIFVSKWPYGYSNHSIQFSPPLFKGRILDNPPKRGDIIVFKPSQEMNKDFIKRLIGLPGDRIQVRGGAVYLNGKPISRKQLPDEMATSPYGDIVKVKRYEETLDSGARYITYDAVDGGEADDTPVYIVPEGHYFMMGDNRDNSRDSRFADPVGFVPYENLEGRADWIMFSNNESIVWWNPLSWFTSLRGDRFFKSLDATKGG